MTLHQPNAGDSTPPKRLEISGASPTAQRDLQGMESSSHRESSRSLPLHPIRRSRSRFWLFFLLLLVSSGAGLAYNFFPKTANLRTDLIVHEVKLEKLQITVLERGALEALENRDVSCQVKSGSRGATFATTIKWVIDDGTKVKHGDLIVELDDSALQEQLKSQQIARDRAKNEAIQAEANKDIVKSQSVSEIATAEVNIQLTDLDSKKFLEGDYVQQKADLKSRVAMAESDLEMWSDRDAWLARMVAKGYMTPKQQLAERFRLESASFALKKANEELRVLNNFTYFRTKKDLDSKILEAGRLKDRLIIQAKAKEIQALNAHLTAQSIYEKELIRFGELEEEIRKCYITAPQDGLVVYYVPEQARFGSGSQQSTIAQGEPVREGQKLMRIPNMTHMLVNTRVHEAMRSRIRGDRWMRTGYGETRQAGLLMMHKPWTILANQAAFFELRSEFHEKEQELVQGGLPALVRIDAFPEKILHGHVKTIEEVASQGDWMSSDIKVYKTMVSIDESLPDLKPGMSASVTIFTDTKADDVLAVPVQAVLGNSQTGFSCFVNTPNGPVEKLIKVGVNNERMVEIKEGLSEGDAVILNPKGLSKDPQKEIRSEPDGGNDVKKKRGGKSKAGGAAAPGASPKQ